MAKNIVIEFEARGDEALVEAIKQLDRATQGLLRTQAGQHDKLKPLVTTQGKHAKQIEALRIKVKALGGEWKKNTQIQNLVKKASRGNRVAMEQLRIVTAGYRRELLKTGAAQLLTVRNNRILGGSIAVARSKMLVFSFAIATTIRPLMNLIKMAGDADETLQKFNVVFGDVSKAMGQWAKDFGGSIGFAESTLQGFASTFQDTFVPLGFAREEAARFSKTLVELAIDVASFSNKLDADVVRDFQSAMVGNHETVKKYGVIINEASLKQKAYEMGLTKSIKELTTMQKTEARLQMIIEGSVDAFGDKIRTMDSYNNQLVAFREQAKQTGEDVGRALMPLATQVLKLMSHFADTDTIYGYVTALGVLGGAFLIMKIRAAEAGAAMVTFRAALIRTGVLAVVVGLGELIAHILETGKKYEEAAEQAKKYYDKIERGDLVLKTEAELFEELADQQRELDRLQDAFDYGHTIDQHGKLTKALRVESEETRKFRAAIGPEIKLRKDNIKVINEERAARGLSVGVVSNEAEAIEALAKAYKASKKGKIADLESTIAMIKANLDMNNLTNDQAIGFEHLISKLEKLTETKTTLSQAEKDAESAIKATVGAQQEAIEAAIDFLITQEDTAETIPFTVEAINNLQAAYEKLDVAKLTDAQENAKQALEATTAAQIVATEATIAQLELDMESIGSSDEYIEAIDNQKEALKKLLEVPRTETEKAIQAAISQTNAAQIVYIKHLIAVMEAQDAAAKATVGHKEAIQDLKDELADLEETTKKSPEWVTKSQDAFLIANTAMDALTEASSMYFANQEAGWASEMKTLKNSDTYKRKSARGREKMENDLLKKQKSAKETAWKQQRALNMAQVVMDTATSIMSIWAQVPKYDFGITAGVLTGIVSALGVAQLGMIASQSMPKFKKGGDFIVPPGFDNDTFPMLVESGERVRVTPKGEVGGTTTTTDSTFNITFSGNVLSDDFIVDEAIPKIKEAIRRGVDIGIS